MGLRSGCGITHTVHHKLYSTREVMHGSITWLYIAVLTDSPLTTAPALILNGIYHIQTCTPGTTSTSSPGLPVPRLQQEMCLQSSENPRQMNAGRERQTTINKSVPHPPHPDPFLPFFLFQPFLPHTTSSPLTATTSHLTPTHHYHTPLTTTTMLFFLRVLYLRVYMFLKYMLFVYIFFTSYMYENTAVTPTHQYHTSPQPLPTSPHSPIPNPTHHYLTPLTTSQ
ncbi:hypothetical protein Pcinc_020468 [Petrolisthes cinctipes]|uniref:Uncharacterized protein n=1 Tax=Petrolisthes cinctipes TaxID=88211 RepID=A0AAE1FJ03_PETCI|nr:hypothetical protein Pcinc_020468 [Petrolisthes cinctipes]